MLNNDDKVLFITHSHAFSMAKKEINVNSIHKL